MPNTLHLPAAKRRRTIGVRVAVGVGLAVVAAVAATSWQVMSQPAVTKSEQEAQDALDKQEAPFTVGVDYDQTPPQGWKVALDRLLTEAERQGLAARRDPEKARAYLLSLGGRTIRYPSGFEDRTDLAMKYTGADATALHLNLFSKRQAQLTITSMEAVDVSCHAPTAKTVVVWQSQGGAAYEGVLFDLTTPGATPVITDEGDDQGAPYFGVRKIDLGGGASPGGLRVEALTRGRSCTWEIKAKYRDAYQGFGTVTLKDGEKPFAAEATPARPEQLWIMDASKPDAEQWVPCHDRPEDTSCRAWREGRAADASASEG
ncbi:hypothetical protein ACFY8W_22020 [Streptomyces sp. NPDC012637]|uniref:hypothetical protein n=1 Tax=Streptomyces sp. NPDC012637 TaxID=3364842 RepID=UPI0036E73F0D